MNSWNDDDDDDDNEIDNDEEINIDDEIDDNERNVMRIECYVNNNENERSWKKVLM